MPISSEQLELARATFTKNTDRDLRDLAFVEALAVIGNRHAARNLIWNAISIDESAIILEYEHIDFGNQSNNWQTVKRIEELERYSLSDVALEAFIRLANRVKERCAEYNIKPLYRDYMFPAVTRGYGDEFSYNEDRKFVDGKWISIRHNFYTMSNTEPREILHRIEATKSDIKAKERISKIAASEQATTINLRIEALKKEISGLEDQLEDLLRPPEKAERKTKREFARALGGYLERRALNALWNCGIHSTEQLKTMSDKQLLAISGIGRVGLVGIKDGIEYLSGNKKSSYELWKERAQVTNPELFANESNND